MPKGRSKLPWRGFRACRCRLAQPVLTMKVGVYQCRVLSPSECSLINYPSAWKKFSVRKSLLLLLSLTAWGKPLINSSNCRNLEVRHTSSPTSFQILQYPHVPCICCVSLKLTCTVVSPTPASIYSTIHFIAKLMTSMVEECVFMCHSIFM